MSLRQTQHQYPLLLHDDLMVTHQTLLSWKLNPVFQVPFISQIFPTVSAIVCATLRSQMVLGEHLIGIPGEMAT